MHCGNDITMQSSNQDFIVRIVWHIFVSTLSFAYLIHTCLSALSQQYTTTTVIRYSYMVQSAPYCLSFWQYSLDKCDIGYPCDFNTTIHISFDCKIICSITTLCANLFLVW